MRTEETGTRHVLAHDDPDLCEDSFRHSNGLCLGSVLVSVEIGWHRQALGVITDKNFLIRIGAHRLESNFKGCLSLLILKIFSTCSDLLTVYLSTLAPTFPTSLEK